MMAMIGRSGPTTANQVLLSCAGCWRWCAVSGGRSSGRVGSAGATTTTTTTATTTAALEWQSRRGVHQSHHRHRQQQTQGIQTRAFKFDITPEALRASEFDLGLNNNFGLNLMKSGPSVELLGSGPRIGAGTSKSSSATTSPKASESTPSAQFSSPASQSQSTQSSAQSSQSHPLSSSFSFYDTTVEEYASRPVRSLQMKDMIEFGKNPTPVKLIRSAQYLQEELLVRMARPIRHMQSLPFIVGVNPHIKSLFFLYWQTFQQLRSLPPVTSIEDEQNFSEVLGRLVAAHTQSTRTLAEAVREIRRLPGSVDFDFDRLDQFIDKFLCERVARRMLAEQHMALHHPADNWIGIIQLRCSPAKLVERCMKRAQEICFKTYGTYPDYNLIGDVEAVMPYIPIHLEYILFELFKNSLRAVVEQHRNSPSLPEVNIRICNGDYVTIHISDQGGGIPPKVMDQVWSYGYTTASSEASENAKANNNAQTIGMQLSMAQEATNESPMAGFGFGLPMARLYTRYLGGDLDIYSMPGYGTDCYIRLKPITEQEEHITI